MTGEGRAEFVRACGPGFVQEEGAVGGGRAGLLNLCAEIMNPSRGQIYTQ